MGYPRIEKFHRFTFVCLFLPPEHASSMVQYLNQEEIKKHGQIM